MVAFPEQRPVRFGRYILLDRINVGGMAEVFRGKTAGVEGFERLVALKRILPDIAADPDFIELFIGEAKLAVQLQHANIAQIYDLGFEHESHYIAMEYVSGVDLRRMWDRARSRNRLLPIAMSCYIMQKVCEGLDAAHRKKDDAGKDIGLVHRDVSPQNILVSFEGEVKVIDFGIARAANRVSKTVAGVLKGKFGYMSPEQVRGVTLDNRSDIFACGAVLYELLVGDRLFLGESDFSTLEKVRNVEMVPPTRLNRNLSPHLERIVMKALTKSREDRYRWAGEMAEDLQRYLFATNQPFARTDIVRYMQQHFKAAIEEEQVRLDRYKTITFESLEPEPEPDGQPVTEVETGLSLAAEGLWGEAEGPSDGPPLVTPAAPAYHAPLPVTPHRTPAAYGRLPTWAAILIGALSVTLVGVIAAIVVLIWGGPEPGSLVVRAKPQSVEIFVNGQLVANEAPFTLDNLEPGTYVVKVTAPRHREAVRAIKIGPGQSRLEAFELKRRQGTAELIVQTEPPGLSVWIDGKDTGRVTPAELAGLDGGTRRVVLKRSDGTPVLRRDIDLEDDRAEELVVDVSQLPPILDIVSIPSRARVSVDGRVFGQTPLTIDSVKPGRPQLGLEYPGCAPFVRRIRLKAATVRKLDVRLVCDPDVR